MKAKKDEMFKKGDWILTTELPKKVGQKYTNAYVLKVKGDGKLLDVQYGTWSNLATVHATSCKLLKRS